MKEIIKATVKGRLSRKIMEELNPFRIPSIRPGTKVMVVNKTPCCVKPKPGVYGSPLKIWLPKKPNGA